MKRIAGLMIAALAACLVMFGCAGESGSADNGITVSAVATAQIEPDLASISFTVPAEGETEDAARAAAEKAVDTVVGHLMDAGLDTRNIELGAIEVSQRFGEEGIAYEPSGYYDWDGNWVETVNEVYYDTSSEVVGYDAKARVKVAGVVADNLGRVIRESASEGAVEFGDLVYEASNREAAYEEALAQAVDAAHVKAESLAKASGVYVGRVVNMVENSTLPDAIAVASDASIIDPGNPATFELIADKAPVEANVTVSYAIS